MLHAEDVTLYFKSKIDRRYREELDRLFYFNGNQKKWEAVVEQSIIDYAYPVLMEKNGKVAIGYEDKGIGQSLHILDSDRPDASLIGVVIYTRESVDTITIIHLVLHEQCSEILKKSGVNIGLMVIRSLIPRFKKLKGVNKLRFYYTNRVIRI
jgi:hypothetical protein